MHLVVAHSEQVAHELVGLADELHVAILDAVVDHLDEVTGAVLANPVAAGRVVLDLGADGLEDRLDERPCGGGAARHHARALERALFTAGDAGADVEQPLPLNILRATDGIRKVGIAAVDEDVAGLKKRYLLLMKGEE